MSELEQLQAHSDAWKENQLIERILARHLHIIEDLGGGTPSYLVSEFDGEDIHQTVEEINSHLSKHGRCVRLTPAEPWLIQVIREPVYQWPRKSFSLVMYSLAVLTTLYAGERWNSSGRPADGWFFENNTLDALLGYSFPLIFTLVVASYAQKYVASKYGVNVPHLVPLPGPALAWWPFGIFGFASLPRSDTRLWPNRSSIGNTALSAPLVIILFGIIFALCGIQLTPINLELESSPLALELPLLLNLSGLSLLGIDELLLKTAWAHPFTRAGCTLMFVGWVSLLPIPTFPGGRILISRMGMAEARSGSSQTMLLMVIALFGFLFGAFDGFTIWLPIVIICVANLLMYGSDPSLPLLLDDSKDLTESEHRKISITLFLAFMFVLPAQIPFDNVDNWDDDFNFEFSNEVVVMEDYWINQTISVSNPSLVAHNFNITYIGDHNSHSEIVDIDCQDYVETSNSCQGLILPKEVLKFSYNIMWNISEYPSHSSQMWLINGQPHMTQIKPNLPIYPIGAWQFNGDLSDPSSCIELEHNIPIENISLGGLPLGAMWKYLDEDNVCIEALSGDDMSWLSTTAIGFNGTNFSVELMLQNFIVIPADGILIDSNHLPFPELQIIALNREDNCSDVGVPSPPLRQDEGDWIWDLSVKSTGMMPTLGNETLLFKAPNQSTISLCINHYNPIVYNVIEGPYISLFENENYSNTNWLGHVNFDKGYVEIENRMTENITLRIEFGGNSANQWNVSGNLTLAAGSITRIDATPPSTGISNSWFDLDDDEIVLNLANHEV
ncbi:MAG: hypothetical protein QGI21_00255 [Candidatus Poseidoniaceae archaeon]|nr:hypothetical protein [Candidatus Poseidoniaceae archaeon]